MPPDLPQWAHRLLDRVPPLHSFVLRRVYGLHRLDAIRHLTLGETLDHAITLYGEPVEAYPHEKVPGATVHVFGQRFLFHQVAATEWQGRIHEVVYWSQYAAPEHDLLVVMRHHGQHHPWRVITDGYSYERQDGYCWLWCSALPWIGVGTCEFLEHRRTQTAVPGIAPSHAVE